jgi:hypothetical protein
MSSTVVLALVDEGNKSADGADKTLDLAAWVDGGRWFVTLELVAEGGGGKSTVLFKEGGLWLVDCPAFAAAELKGWRF